MINSVLRPLGIKLFLLSCPACLRRWVVVVMGIEGGGLVWLQFNAHK